VPYVNWITRRYYKCIIGNKYLSFVLVSLHQNTPPYHFPIDKDNKDIKCNACTRELYRCITYNIIIPKSSFIEMIKKMVLYNIINIIIRVSDSIWAVVYIIYPKTYPDFWHFSRDGIAKIDCQGTNIVRLLKCVYIVYSIILQFMFTPHICYIEG